MRLLTGLAVNWDEEREIIDGADIAAWRAEAAENSSDNLLPLYEEALATEQDEQRRRNVQGIRDWVAAAGNPIDARDSSMRSYDCVLAELPALLTLLDDENPRVRTRTAYLLAWFPELADTSVPLLLDLATHEYDAVAKATSLVAVGILGTIALAKTLATDLDAEDSLVRWAAAAAVAQTAKSADAELDGPLLAGPWPNSLPLPRPPRPYPRPTTTRATSTATPPTFCSPSRLPPLRAPRSPPACRPSTRGRGRSRRRRSCRTCSPSPCPIPALRTRAFPAPSSSFCMPSPTLGEGWCTRRVTSART
ncbi:HEAT repeat domain-containing protein [Streptomyces sp. NPDC001435]|uniref:HEAT repeat domain-containing protein n=1 Tax=Streptomyces sp. NPDC001435 TaxID=3364576 RepID=UPI0036A9E515